MGHRAHQWPITYKRAYGAGWCTPWYPRGPEPPMFRQNWILPILVYPTEKMRQHLGPERIKPVAKQLRGAVSEAVYTGEDSVLSFSG